MLLVLDNFEHLLEGAELLPPLLHAAPGLKLLVTSRARLHLAEEWLLPLGGLASGNQPRPRASPSICPRWRLCCNWCWAAR